MMAQVNDGSETKNVSEEGNKVMKDETSPSEADAENDSEENIEEKYLIRDCEVYSDEYDECTSFRARFHQYFIYGETLDCNQWKRDYDNCCKWVENEDKKAASALIKSEKDRRMSRLRAHYRNDIWKKRDAPPEDWSAPLPEWMAKRDENTYLAKRAHEIREGTDNQPEEKESSCTIM
ncbi:unnamed protein product [Colias eurytheme]|nr:unnamed protein product [Colias eurytheme]